MGFGDVIRYGYPPSGSPIDIGGTNSTIWHCDYWTGKVYELSSVDFSVIRYATAPGSVNWPSGIGGDDNTIWHAQDYDRRIHELSTVDLSSIRSAAAPGGYPPGTGGSYGIGGTNNVIWHADLHTNRVHELSTVDLSSIRYGSGPGGSLRGCGGDENIIWNVTRSNNIWELSITDFSAVRHTNGPNTNVPYASGIGGNYHTLYFTDSNGNPDRIWELNPATPGKIYVGDTVLLVPNYGDIYDKACVKGTTVRTGDNVKLYPLKGGVKVAITELWSAGDKITF